MHWRLGFDMLLIHSNDLVKSKNPRPSTEFKYAILSLPISVSLDVDFCLSKVFPTSCIQVAAFREPTAFVLVPSPQMSLDISRQHLEEAPYKTQTSFPQPTFVHDRTMSQGSLESASDASTITS
jgi:hypothetical protein